VVDSSRAHPVIRFVNTFYPVAPLYQEVLPRLEACGWRPLALLSKGVYRGTRLSKEEAWLDHYGEFVHVPSPLRRKKRWSNIFYWVLAPLRLLTNSSQAIVLLTQPPLFFILGAAIARYKRVPYVIHVMDMFPDLLQKLGILKQHGFLHRLLARWAVKALDKAEGIIVIGRCMRERVRAYGIGHEKIHVLPNWAYQLVLPKNREENQFLQSHQLEDKFVVLYSGNMGAAHEFRTILRAAERLEQHVEILFVFIGQGVRRKEVEQAIAEGPSNLMLLEYQPLAMLAHSLSAANVHYMSLRSGFEGIMVPSKLYGALASRRPILYEGDPSGEVALTIKENRCGLVIPHLDVDQLTDSILHYFNSKEAADADGDRAWQAHTSIYTPEQGADRYVQALIRILDLDSVLN
jgi:glycosyltransferase involved in cell wall biosynthesis